MTRREFLLSSGAVTLLSGCRSFDLFGAPEMTFGVVSDIHVTTPKSCAMFEKALRQFKRRGVDAVMVPGDLTDWGLKASLRYVKETWDRVFGGTDVVPLFCTGNHDYDGWAYGDMTMEMHANGYSEADRMVKGGVGAAWEEILGERFGDVRCRSVKGFDFVSCEYRPENPEALKTWFEENRARLTGTRPFFFFQHLPIKGTTVDSFGWADNGVTKPVLDAFPNCVAFTGHTHRPFIDERQIWQGEFTAINIGCLQTWAGFAAGSTPPDQAKEAYTVLLMDVYRDRLVVERYDVRDRSKCGPDWVVPLPFAAESAPYAPARAAQRVKALPMFAADAKVTVSVEEEGYRFSFPEASKGPRAFKYVLACERRNAKGKWERFTHDEIFGDFHIAPKDRTGETSCVLSAGFFAPGESYRATVTPQDCFGHSSASIASAVFTGGPAKATTLWSLGENSFTATENGKPMSKDKDGFYAPKSGQGTLHLPLKRFANLETNRVHRLVLDLHTVQQAGDWCGWRISLSSLKNGRKARRMVYASIQTPTGDSGMLRYVMEFKPGEKFPESCNLVFPNVVPNGRIRVVSVRLEREESLRK